ncbi:uncharacterized protein A1O9_01545 [Exophiala aquamarina CBS 119918]|uniref:Uncharacterized protein n=1 Tax=Exophiala aquamarina CBS 119918 TaxID=1182545 RepID=A0A072PUY1_9EURO|nr:uncharacterized protein A1O9_01545 [Exophiala aquamarina CBS 119918]KEF63567.1 hypothetical protein A1O9_01545 [Exophiala aquamarina CBS 119918]
MAPPLEDIRPAFELRGRNYVITGGAGGIGFAAARAICELGGNVAILDVQEKPVDEFETLSSKFGAKTFYFQADVTNQESLSSAFGKAVEALGTIDGLVPSAGIAIDKPFVDQTWEEFTRIHEINCRGLFFSCQLAAKQMIKQGKGGSMVLLASQTAHIAIPGHRMAAYNMSKGGVLMLTKALGVELAPHNIRVNSISPGFVDSEMLQKVKAAKGPQEAEQLEISPPMKRLSNQNDLTGAIIYLLSDAARFTTAIDIPITGGLHAGTIEGLIYYP